MAPPVASVRLQRVAITCKGALGGGAMLALRRRQRDDAVMLH